MKVAAAVHLPDASLAGRRKLTLGRIVTFPAHRKDRKARQDRFDSRRKRFLNSWGESITVPEPHKSGEVRSHGVVRAEDRNFALGFDPEARKRWVKSRSEADRDLWMRSASPDLREAWRLRRSSKKSYGPGHVDVVPLWPTTEPLAVARYIANYASHVAHPEGTRMVRRVGWRRSEELPIKAYAVSFAGPRARLVGRLKENGDTGNRNRGWVLRATHAALHLLKGSWPFTIEEMEAVCHSVCRSIDANQGEAHWTRSRYPPKLVRACKTRQSR